MIENSIRVYPGAEMTAQDFAVLIEQLTTQDNGVLVGCVVSLKTGTTLHVTPGWAVLHGRIVRIEGGDISVPLSTTSNLTKYLVLKVDLENTGVPSTVDIYDSVGIDSADFNTNDRGSAYLELAHFTVGTTAVSGVVNKDRINKTSAVRYGTGDPSNSVGRDGDIYIKVES